MLPALPLVFLTFVLPESPRYVEVVRVPEPPTDTHRWLIQKGRHEDALRSLARLHARGNVNDSLVQAEYESMRLQTEADASLDQSWRLVSPGTQHTWSLEAL
jgi:hypothetical protein